MKINKGMLTLSFKAKGYFTPEELAKWHELTGFKGITPEEKVLRQLALPTLPITVGRNSES